MKSAVGKRTGANAAARTWRAAAYMRLSREDGPEGESGSIESQRKMILDWAAAHGGVALVAEYADDGYSGANFDRPAFARMVEDARAGLFDTVVVKDLSRFGRSYLDCGYWVERGLPQLGVRLYAISDDFDSMRAWDYDTALLFPMKNLLNEMQVMATSQKVRTSLAAKRKRGEFVGNFAPYGYARDPADRHRLVVDPVAAAVVQRIFELFLGGQSASAIARMLNREGVPSPAEHKRRAGLGYRSGFAQGASRWHAESVLRILANEVYTGMLVQGKTRKQSWRSPVVLQVAPEERDCCENAHEAIVSSEDFRAVALLLGR